MRLHDCEVGMWVAMPVVVETRRTGEWRTGRITVGHKPYHGAPDTVIVRWSDGQEQLVTARSLLNEQEYDEQASKERLLKMSIKKEDCVIDMRVALAGSDGTFPQGKDCFARQCQPGHRGV